MLTLQFPAPSQVSAPEQAAAVLLPHALPAALFPPSTQTEVPVEHEVTPALQRFGLVVQARPAVQAEHVPALHTRLVPQLVPSGSEVVVSVHTGAPVEQERVPVWHVLAGVQDCPLLHVTHAPALHTMPLPQVVPAAVLPVSTQTELPVVHEVAPVLQALAG